MCYVGGRESECRVGKLSLASPWDGFLGLMFELHVTVAPAYIIPQNLQGCITSLLYTVICT